MSEGTFGPRLVVDNLHGGKVPQVELPMPDPATTGELVTSDILKSTYGYVVEKMPASFGVILLANNAQLLALKPRLSTLSNDVLFRYLTSSPAVYEPKHCIQTCAVLAIVRQRLTQEDSTEFSSLEWQKDSAEIIYQTLACMPEGLKASLRVPTDDILKVKESIADQPINLLRAYIEMGLGMGTLWDEPMINNTLAVILCVQESLGLE